MAEIEIRHTIQKTKAHKKSLENEKLIRNHWKIKCYDKEREATSLNVFFTGVSLQVKPAWNYLLSVSLKTLGKRFAQICPVKCIIWRKILENFHQKP